MKPHEVGTNSGSPGCSPPDLRELWRRPPSLRLILVYATPPGPVGRFAARSSVAVACDSSRPSRFPTWARPSFFRTVVSCRTLPAGGVGTKGGGTAAGGAGSAAAGATGAGVAAAGEGGAVGACG